MIKSILLVGCGNIGSRHLQALVQLQTPVEIHIVEKSNNSQKLAKLRLDEISYDKTNHIANKFPQSSQLNHTLHS